MLLELQQSPHLLPFPKAKVQGFFSYIHHCMRSWKFSKEKTHLEAEVLKRSGLGRREKAVRWVRKGNVG